MEGVNYNYRYGKFPYTKLSILIWVGFCIFIIVFIKYERNLIFGLFASAFFVWRMFSPCFEKFRFENERIITQKFKYREIIDIPEKAIFVLSYTMVEQSVARKDCYSVNIVDENIDTILEKLHADDRACEWVAYRHKIKKLLIYDNTYIESIFKNKVVYSFVYNNETQHIFNDLKRTVILPHSIASNISIEENDFDVIIDEGR